MKTRKIIVLAANVHYDDFILIYGLFRIRLCYIFNNYVFSECCH